MSQTFLNPALSMTSREIADLTGNNIRISCGTYAP